MSNILKIYHNTLIEDNADTEEEFRYNFVNLPWDDRSRKSKIGIVALLIAIFTVIMALVINSFIWHYKGFELRRFDLKPEINCHSVILDVYPFVARIRSSASLDLICVGALISHNIVLSNGACVSNRAMPLHFRLGSLSDPRCKKGYTVSVMESFSIDVDEKISLATLSSYGNLTECGSVAKIGADSLNKTAAFVIGKPLRGDKSLSRQPVLIDPENCTCPVDVRNNTWKPICVKTFGRCPVTEGDILVQDGNVLGLALKSRGTPDICFIGLKSLHSMIIPDS